MDALLMTMNMYLFAASGSTTIDGVTSGATALLTWALSSFTSIVTWVLGNPLALTIAVMFIVGFAVSLLIRVLHSI